MYLRTETLEKKKIVGRSIDMSFENDRTSLLWQGFLRELPKIRNRCGPDLISMQIYPPQWDPASFDPGQEFQKWAAAEVLDLDNIPAGLTGHTMRGGQYAVFLHRGKASDFPRTAAYIYGHWLPKSGFDLDQREHFELLPPGYDPRNPKAEEEVWIPVKKKT